MRHAPWQKMRMSNYNLSRKDLSQRKWEIQKKTQTPMPVSTHSFIHTSRKTMASKIPGRNTLGSKTQTHKVISKRTTQNPQTVNRNKGRSKIKHQETNSGNPEPRMCTLSKTLIKGRTFGGVSIRKMLVVEFGGDWGR